MFGETFVTVHLYLIQLFVLILQLQVPTFVCYFTNTDAIIYVVDSNDRDRVGISKQELVSMLEEDELKDAVLVVLANKQDIEGAMSVTEVHGALGLDKLKNRTFQIFKVNKHIDVRTHIILPLLPRPVLPRGRGWTKAWSGPAIFFRTRSREWKVKEEE